MLAKVIFAGACILVTTARCHQNVSSRQGTILISVDCSKQHGHVDITVPAYLPPSAIPCPACICQPQPCPGCTCPRHDCPACPGCNCPRLDCPACPGCNCPRHDCPACPGCTCPRHDCPACPGQPPSLSATPTASGYEFFPGLGHYKFHPYGATWQQGQQRCSDEGTRLVVLNSQREADVVVGLFTRYPTMPGAEQTGWAWTAVHEQGEDGNYVTLSGESLSATGFTIWSPSEPNDGGPNDCVLTNRVNAYLADAGCQRLFAFICELEL